MSMKLRVVLAVAMAIAAISALCSTEAGIAEPMPRASLNEAARTCHVVLASYQSHESPAGRSDEDVYFSGVKTSYKVDSILKLNSKDVSKSADAKLEPGKTVTVRFIVHDLSPCMVDESFHFSEKLLPTKGSKWILFLQPKTNALDWYTYRGSEGRLEANPSNIDKVKALLAL